jgi:hypothetical protein
MRSSFFLLASALALSAVACSAEAQMEHNPAAFDAATHITEGDVIKDGAKINVDLTKERATYKIELRDDLKSKVVLERPAGSVSLPAYLEELEAIGADYKGKAIQITTEPSTALSNDDLEKHPACKGAIVVCALAETGGLTQCVCAPK